MLKGLPLDAVVFGLRRIPPFVLFLFPVTGLFLFLFAGCRALPLLRNRCGLTSLRDGRVGIGLLLFDAVRLSFRRGSI